MSSSLVTTVTSGGYSLLYTMDEGKSELFDLRQDPRQQSNIIASEIDTANELHQLMLKFMRDTNTPQRLIDSRLELKL